MTILGFMVRKLLGEIGIRLSGSARLSTDKGRMLIIAAASQKNVSSSTVYYYYYLYYVHTWYK